MNSIIMTKVFQEEFASAVFLHLGKTIVMFILHFKTIKYPFLVTKNM